MQLVGAGRSTSVPSGHPNRLVRALPKLIVRVRSRHPLHEEACSSSSHSPREHASIDFAGFSGETLHGVMQGPPQPGSDPMVLTENEGLALPGDLGPEWPQWSERLVGLHMPGGPLALGSGSACLEGS